MADNTVLNAGSGGDTIATEDRGSYKTPISLIDVGGRTGPEAIIGDSGVTMPVSLSSVPSHAVTNAGTFAVQVDGDALTSLQLIDNAVSGAGFNITQFAGAAVPIGAGLEATALRVTLATDSTGVISIDDNGGSITVDGTVAVSGSVVVTDGGGSLTVDNNGTFAVQAAQSGTWNVGTVTTVTGVTTVTTLTTCSTVTTLTGSGVAHDAADSGNPHKVGAKATSSLSGLTLVADADRTNLFAGLDGVLITRPHCNLEDIVSGVASITDGSSTSVIAAQGAGVKTYVTSVTVANTSATDVTVDLRDGTAGTVKWTFPVPNLGGVTHTFNPPLAFSANTIVAADPSAAASTVTVSISGFKSKV